MLPTHNIGYLTMPFPGDGAGTALLRTDGNVMVQETRHSDREGFERRRGWRHFFSPAVQLTTSVMAADAVSSTRVLTRKRWPSAETSYG
jgi:hypothetical protein